MEKRAYGEIEESIRGTIRIIKMEDKVIIRSDFCRVYNGKLKNRTYYSRPQQTGKKQSTDINVSSAVNNILVLFSVD